MTASINWMFIILGFVIGIPTGYQARKTYQWWHRVKAGWRLVEPFVKHAAMAMGALFVLVLVGLKYLGAI